jgi:hypothetical protein
MCKWVLEKVSEWLLLNVNSAIFQLCNGMRAIPNRVKPKTIKLVLVILRYGRNIKEKDQKLVESVSG